MAFSGDGAGTVGDPYIITNATQLQEMIDEADAYYALGNNIDCSETRTWNPRDPANYPGVYYGFDPCGDYANSERFTGALDGGGYTISHLYINRTTDNAAPHTGYVGLFANLHSSVEWPDAGIKDFVLANVDITGQNIVGGLAGQSVGDLKISNVIVSGTVESEGKHPGGGGSGGLGGLIGHADPGFSSAVISDCVASCTLIHSTEVTGAGEHVYAGGLVGLVASDCTFNDCVAGGAIYISTYMNTTGTSTVAIGGFCGHGGTNVPTANRCSSSVEISCTATSSSSDTLVRIGGFSGVTTPDCAACIASGEISNTTSLKSWVGGFAALPSANVSLCAASTTIESNCTNTTTNYAGGFAGSLSSDISNCYATGSVNRVTGQAVPNQEIGGFVGHHSSGDTGNCYCVGEVAPDGDSARVGGFSGYYGTGNITNCFWDKETSTWVTSNDDGGSSGKTTEEMKTLETFTDAGWDFDAVWQLNTYVRPLVANSNLTIWSSATGDYEDFDVGTKDANSFSILLPSTNEIMWISALESLIAGTASSEWKVGSNKFDTKMTPTNFSAREQTTHGSKKIQAVKVGSVILYVDKVGRKVREVAWSAADEKYVAPDMTSLAEHITESGIVCMDFQKDPDPILWCVLGNGTLISFYYDREQNIIAWSRHPIDGLVQSVLVTPGEEEDEITISLSRTINGQTVYYIEKLASRTFDTQADCHFLDCGFVKEETTKFTKVTGLSHLEGETVSVLGDGAVQTPKTVQSGQIVLDEAVLKMHIGFPFTYVLQPMRWAPPGQRGTSFGEIKGIPTASVNFYKTLLAKYGSSMDNLFDLNWRTTEDYNSPPSLFSGDKECSIDGGYKPDATIVITGDSPFPCTVRSITARIDVMGK